jgi:pectate lyase
MIKFTVSLFGLLLASSISFGYSKTDKPEGWASQAGGTTGGAGGTEVTVSTMAQLQTEAKSSGKKIILVNKGTYTGALTIASDKTILGKEPGVVIKGYVKISKVSNVILRNIAIQGDRCNTYDECKAGSDALQINNEAHHVWLDHLDISDGQDGNCDITNGSDYVTITWSKFWYSYDKQHRFSNLIAGDDNLAIDKDKLRITYAYNWWADRVVERQPRGRAGKVHVVNNLYTSTATNYACGPGVDIQMLIENNAFKNAGTAIKEFTGTPAAAWKSVGNIGTAKDISTNKGTVFTPPYTLSQKMPASEVEAKVRPAAGNTLTLNTTSVAPRQAPHVPYVAASGPGWTLHNPGTLAVEFRVVDAAGRELLSRAKLEAGGSLAMPSSGAPFFVRFLGADRPADLYVPFAK